MSRVVHFEIQVDDVERAKAFYSAVFGWEFQDWSEVVGSVYWGASTGPDDQMGINGGLLQRSAAVSSSAQGANAFVCTMQVEDYDAAEAAILANGGTLALPKYALPRMAWQGYYLDTEGNTIGIHQPDENAA
jgi:predicted enzyme related to lactoylglutathione lyase